MWPAEGMVFSVRAGETQPPGMEAAAEISGVTLIRK